MEGRVVRSVFLAAGFLLLFASIPSIGETGDTLPPAAVAGGDSDGAMAGNSPDSAPASTAVPAEAARSRRPRSGAFPPLPHAPEVLPAPAQGVSESDHRSRPGVPPIPGPPGPAGNPPPGDSRARRRSVPPPAPPQGIFRRAPFRKGTRPGPLPERGRSRGDEKPRGRSGRIGRIGGRVLHHRLDGGRERERGGLLRDHPADRQVHPLFPDPGTREVRTVSVPLGEIRRDDAEDPHPVRTPRGPRLRRADRKRVLPQGVLRGEGSRPLAVHLRNRTQVRPPHRLVGRRASGRREVDARRRFLSPRSLRDVRVVAACHRRVQCRRGEDPEGGRPVQIRRFFRAHPSPLPEAGDEGLRPQDAGGADHRQGSRKIRVRGCRLRGAAGSAHRDGAGRDRPEGGGRSSRGPGGGDLRLESGASAVLHTAEPGAIRPPALRRRGASRRGADGGDPGQGEDHLPTAQSPQGGNAAVARRPVRDDGPHPQGVEWAEAEFPEAHRAPGHPRDGVDGDRGGPRDRDFAGPSHDGAHAGGGGRPKVARKESAASRPGGCRNRPEGGHADAHREEARGSGEGSRERKRTEDDVDTSRRVRISFCRNPAG